MVALLKITKHSDRYRQVEEAIQHAYMKLLQRIQKEGPDFLKEEPIKYMYVCARNYIFNELRRHRTHFNHERAIQVDGDNRNQQVYGYNQSHARLEALLDGQKLLSFAEKEVFGNNPKPRKKLRRKAFRTGLSMTSDGLTEAEQAKNAGQHHESYRTKKRLAMIEIREKWEEWTAKKRAEALADGSSKS